MTAMRQPTVLLADDHVVFTDGIVRILQDRFEVVGTVTDGGSLFEATPEEPVQTKSTSQIEPFSP